MRREAFDLIMRSCWQPSSIMQLCRSPDSKDALIHGAGEIPATPALLQQRSSVTPASPPLTLTCLYLMFFSSVVLGICMYTFGCTMSTYISNKNAVEILKRHHPSSHSAASERCGCFYKEEAFWRI